MLSRNSHVNTSAAEQKLNEKGILLMPCHNNQAHDEVIEAVQSAIRDCPAVQALRYITGRTELDSMDQFELSPGINCALHHDVESNEKCIRLSSHTVSVQEIQAFIDNAVTQYKLHVQNKLEGRLYVFDQVPFPGLNTTRNLNIPAFSKLQFEKQKFVTGKCFSNIFFTQKALVESRVRFFLDRPDWYLEKGVAHSLGILLTGPPGTGKTSLIKAIARESNRHIVNVDMANIQTKQQFADLFHGDELHCRNKELSGDRCETLLIPVKGRILILEDIDCAAENITWDRKYLDEQKQEGENANKRLEKIQSSERIDPDYIVKKDRRQPSDRRIHNSIEDIYEVISKTMSSTIADEQQKPVKSTLTLNDVLNVLDGVCESQNRIIIMTSNHIEKIDPALLRPGRCDLTVKFELATRKTITEMFQCYFDQSIPDSDVSQLPDQIYSPAYISSLMLGNFQDPDAALQKLLELPHEI